MKKGKIKKVNKKIKLIILIAIVLIIAIISTIIIRNVIRQKEIENNKYLATGNENSSLIANYIKKGVTIGGITGTFEVLDTSDATGEIDATTNSEKIKSSSSASYYYTEKMPTDEEASVNANGGYYIGRFEAGDKVSTEAKKMRTSGDSQTNEVSIKKGQAPYVYATYENQKALAEGMGSKRGYIGTTKMVSSYAWDTAINFIQIKTPDYDSNSPQGNYLDTTFSYANVGETEKSQTKGKGEAKIVPTGQTTAVSNIYDMGGNAWERTTENTILTSYPISRRGGDYTYNNSERAAGWRNDSNGNHGSSDSFRITLFCSTEA